MAMQLHVSKVGQTTHSNKTTGTDNGKSCSPNYNPEIMKGFQNTQN